MIQAPERFCFWRQQARQSEFTGLVQIVAIVFVATSIVTVTVASCFAGPEVLFIDGIARIYEQMVTW